MTNKEAIQEIEGIFENVYGLSVREREALETAIDALKENESLARTVNEASELIRKKRPHGEWVLDKEFSFIFNMYECSKCRFNGSKRWHFCPNCGADMRKEGE